PPEASTHGSSRSSHLVVMPCICGTDLVVVARLRAAAVLRLSEGCPLAGALGSVSIDTKQFPFMLKGRRVLIGVGLITGLISTRDAAYPCQTEWNQEWRLKPMLSIPKKEPEEIIIKWVPFPALSA